MELETSGYLLGCNPEQFSFILCAAFATHIISSIFATLAHSVQQEVTQ